MLTSLDFHGLPELLTVDFAETILLAISVDNLKTCNGCCNLYQALIKHFGINLKKKTNHLDAIKANFCNLSQ